MTVARYLERHGLLEECIGWLKQHYPKVEHLLQNNKFSFCEIVLWLGIAHILRNASSPIPPSKAGQDQDEVSLE